MSEGNVSVGVEANGVVASVDDLSPFDLGSGQVAYGWDDVFDLLEQQKVGSFLKLKNGETVIMSLIGKPLAYIAHRAPVLDSEGYIVMGNDGREKKELVACKRVYTENGGRCVHCDNSVPTSLRTACAVAIWQLGKDGKGMTCIAVSVLEGGPQLWKSRMAPYLKEYGPAYLYSLKRTGEGLNTDYTFVPRANGTITPMMAAAVAKFQIPSVSEIVRLNKSEE